MHSHFGFVAVGIAVGLASSTAAAQENHATSLSAPMAAPSDAFELKVGTGYTQGLGMVAPNRSLPSTAGAGLGLGLSLDFRTSTHWSVGAAGEYQELRQEQNSSVRGVATNIGATYHFIPEAVGDPWVRLGTGYRFVWENNPVGTSFSSVQRHGFELAALTVGYDVRLNEDIAIAPTIGADLDMFLWQNPSGTGNSALSSAAVGTFVYAGLQGRFDMGGTRKGGGRTIASEPIPLESTSADIPVAPPPEPMAPPIVATTPVAPTIAVSQDILQACQLKLGSIEQTPKFDFDQSALMPADVEILSQIAACFTTGPMQGMSLTLVGRADPRGSVAYNDTLGLKRARMVDDFLAKAGVDATKIVTTSRGKRDAVGTDPTTWAVDRRVDVLSP